MMECEDCRSILFDSLDTEDKRPPGVEATDHLKSCADCRDWWTELSGASRCLRTVQPPLIEAPPVSAVWARVRTRHRKTAQQVHSRRETLVGWVVDVFGVFGAAAVIALAALGIRTLLSDADIVVPIVSIHLGSLASEAWAAVALVVLLGSFAGACSAPLLLRGCSHESRRHA